MKIVHLIGYFQPEFGYKEYYIARNQAKAGHEVHVITSDRVFPFPDYPKLAAKIGASTSHFRGVGDSVVEGIKVHRLPSLFELKEFIVIKGIKDLLKKIKPTIVHAYPPNHGCTVLGAFYKKDFKYFLIGDDQILIDAKKLKAYSTFKGMLRYELFQSHLSRFYFNRCDVIFCPNKTSKTYIGERFNVSNKLKVVPIGFDPEFYHYDEDERKTVRKKFNIQKKDFVILLIGRLTLEKGFDKAIKASARLLKQSKVKLLIVGDGSFKENLVEQVNNLGISSSTRFAGFVPERELYKYYSCVDLAVWVKRPSVGISNAIGCSLPVLLPKTKIFSYYIELGAGREFEPNKEGDLENKLSEIVENKKIYSTLKQNIKAAKKYLDYSLLANKDIEVYEQFKRTSN